MLKGLSNRSIVIQQIIGRGILNRSFKKEKSSAKHIIHQVCFEQSKEQRRRLRKKHLETSALYY